ncbi:hypothetical protein PSHT_12217 [Puccinia striiformis]|uniref:Uncharacterized protein n=1 Tax=Puccinia striiformis TaxID=27350 RepID=A0A2S4UY86_9BASI|nr:hypothetical protein PSHT_12217 [Puccinia striiformis]
MINTSHGSYAQHDCQRPSPSHPYAAIKVSKPSRPQALVRGPVVKVNMSVQPTTAAFLPFVGPRQIHFALASPQSNKSLIIRLLPKQQASPLNPSYGAELTAQGLRQHLPHHRISSKSADHFPELLELFAECAEELPVARSHQDNPGIRRSARIRAIMDTPKEATGPSSRFNETHSTSMSNKRALGLSEGGSAVCMGPHITRDSPDDPERSKGKGGVFDPKTSLQTPAPKPQHRDSKAPKKRTSNDKSDVTSKRYHRGNKASSKQIGPDDQTTTPSKPHHRENNTPADTAASGEGVVWKVARRNEFSVLGTNLNYTPRSTCQVDRGNLLATLTKRKADSLGALADFENPSIVPNVEEHVRITTPDNKCHQPCKLPNIQVWAKVRRSLPPIVTGGAEVLEQHEHDLCYLSLHLLVDINRRFYKRSFLAWYRQSHLPFPKPCSISKRVPFHHLSPHLGDAPYLVMMRNVVHLSQNSKHLIFWKVPGQNHSLEMHTAPVDSPFFCISPRTLSNTPFPGTPLSMGRTVGKHPIGHLEDNQGNHLKITMPTIQLSHGSNSTNTDRSNLPLDQFLLSPLLVHDQSSMDSNYLIWQVAIDQTLSYVTHQEGPFVSKISSFSTLPMSESRSIEVLIRNTIDPKLLVILDSRKLQTPGKMCELLNRMYQPTNRRHKLNAIKSLNKLIKCNRTISERWVVIGIKLILKSVNSNSQMTNLWSKLPNEVDPTVLDSLTNRRHKIIQILPLTKSLPKYLRFKLDKTLEEPFEAEKPKVSIKERRIMKMGRKREGKGKESSERRGVSP